uniref:Uncharacterized protein n=1 Tax=Avena sativa TaxID=4498 RepID=A0ACD5V9L1_AVESA
MPVERWHLRGHHHHCEMEPGTRRGMRAALMFLALVFMSMAVAARAAAEGSSDATDGVGGTPDGDEAFEKRFLKLWTDGGGGDKEDHLRWYGDDDDEYDGDGEDQVENEGVSLVLGGARCPGPGKKKKRKRNVVRVDDFGAAGDGGTDDTEAFAKAWEQACSVKDAVFVVTAGKRYKVGPIRFMGPCKEKLVVLIHGTIVAPDEPSEWDPKSPRLWLLFGGLDGARIQGGGVIDGSGCKWWANSCKTDRSKPCRPAPTAVTIDSCSGVRVRSLRIQNAQQMHLTVSRSRGVRLDKLAISAPEDSPNTDGIHVAESSAVTITACRIGTGDDCVSISNASFAVKMRGIVCDPGHGISIGSLGQGGSYAAVEGVSLDDARISRAQNGVRIKTWQGGAGYVRNVRFSNVLVEDVDHPIIIDQFYCDSRTPCANQSTNVQVSNVMYRNITGTSRRAEAIRFACSDAVPCSGIVLSNINLLREDGSEVQTVCNCAMGMGYEPVRPAADCLRDSSCGGGGGEKKVGAEEPAAPLLHTEL